MSVDAWGKLWEKAVGLAGHSAILQLEEDCGRATVVWPDGSRIGLVFDNGDWHRCDPTPVAADQTRPVESVGIDDQIRKLLEDIRDNYEPELIAYECAVQALALLDAKSTKTQAGRVDHPHVRCAVRKKMKGGDERTTAKTERMKRAEVAKPAPIPALVGSTAWVLHDDHPQGYEVSLHASELGVYDAALVRIHQLVDDGDIDKDNEDVMAAIEAMDGRVALKAFDAIISEDGDEATGRVHLWITEQKVDR